MQLPRSETHSPQLGEALEHFKEMTTITRASGRELLDEMRKDRKEAEDSVERWLEELDKRVEKMKQ